MPVVMPAYEALHGMVYTVNGDVMSVPEDSGKVVVQVARNVRPPR